MEQEQDPSPEYIKAFNTGYQLNQYEPEFLNKVLSSLDQESEAFKALLDGKKEQELEKIKGITDRNREQDKGLEL